MKKEKREVNDITCVSIYNILYYTLYSPFTPSRTQIEFFATLAVQTPSQRPICVSVCEGGVKKGNEDFGCGWWLLGGYSPPSALLVGLPKCTFVRQVPAPGKLSLISATSQGKAFAKKIAVRRQASTPQARGLC